MTTLRHVAARGVAETLERMNTTSVTQLPTATSRASLRASVLRFRTCPFCDAVGSLDAVPHPSGLLLRCRRCFRVRRAPGVARRLPTPRRAG
jgi:hypothetical protein